MHYALSMLLALSSTAWSAEAAQYLPSIQQRWDASDLVCIGDASSPVRTGLIFCARKDWWTSMRL
jgi:hypothetical protein